MDPITIAALASTVASIGSSALNWYNQRRSERWQTDLANTAVQRRVADLRAAGLNPILAANGAGAPVPSVAPVRFENPLEQWPEAMATSARVKNETRTTQEQLDKLKADTDVSREQLKNMRSTVQLQEAQEALTRATARATEQKIHMGDPAEQLMRTLGNTLERWFKSRSREQDAPGVLERLQSFLDGPGVPLKKKMPSNLVEQIFSGQMVWSNRHNGSVLDQVLDWIGKQYDAMGAKSAKDVGAVEMGVGP